MHRAIIGEFVVYEVVPAGNAVEFAVGLFHTLVVAEIAGITLYGIGVRSTRRKSVAHLASHAAVIHQRCHCIVLSLGCRTAVYVEHIVPVECGLAEIEREFSCCAIDGWGVCHRAGAFGWVVVIFHHLRHGGGGATGDAALRCVVHRAHVVERCALVPLGGTQRSYGFARRHHRRCRVGVDVECGGIVDFALILVEQVEHCRWYVGRVERAAVAVAEHFLGVAFARHYHEAVAGGVEHVETVAAVIGILGVNQLYIGACCRFQSV